MFWSRRGDHLPSSRLKLFQFNLSCKTCHINTNFIRRFINSFNFRLSKLNDIVVICSFPITLWIIIRQQYWPHKYISHCVFDCVQSYFHTICISLLLCPKLWVNTIRSCFATTSPVNTRICQGVDGNTDN